MSTEAFKFFIEQQQVEGKVYSSDLVDSLRTAFEAGIAYRPTQVGNLRKGTLFRRPNGKQVYLLIGHAAPPPGTLAWVLATNAKGNVNNFNPLEDIVVVEDQQSFWDAKDQ